MKPVSITKNQTISVFHLNIRSLSKHHLELEAYLDTLKHKFDVVCLSEVGRYNVATLSNILDNYRFQFVPSNTKNGGVGVFIKNVHTICDIYQGSIQNNLLCHTDCCQIEDLWIDAKFEGCTKPITLCVCYRHPKGKVGHFTTALENTLSQIKNTTPVIIAGDFNIDLIKTDSNIQHDNYAKLLLSNAFIPTITLPTRITERSKTLIDHIFVRLPPKQLESKITSGNLFCDISDHLPNFCIIETKSKTINKNRPMIRLYNAKNYANYINKLESLSFDQIFACTGANEAYNILSNLIKDIHDECFPEVRLSRKKFKDKPWITKSLKKLISTKNAIYRQYTKSPTEALKKKLQEHKASLKTALSEAQSSYYKKLLSDRQTCARKAWSMLNAILNNKTKTNCPIMPINYNNKELHDPEAISNAMNEHFVNIGSRLASNLPAHQNANQFFDKKIDSSFFLHPSDSVEIFNEINKLKDNKSPGIDDIPVKLIKVGAATLAPVLSHIFNLSINNGKYPDKLKEAKVIPIYKKGDRKDPENYRPISLLPCFNKIFEKLIDKRLRDFLEVNNILYEHQFGFRKGHSTTLALIEATNNLHKHLDNNEYVLGLFLDLKKAFDTVDHNILLEKLENYGIRGKPLELITSYLTNRTQCTFVNNKLSKSSKITSGVPQGSVLGPLLFILYINDIKNAVPNVPLQLFADDTSVFIHNNNYAKLIDTTKETLLNLIKWFESNKLTLHLGKSTYIIFQPSSNNKSSLEDYFTLDGIKINRSKSTKYLGIHLDEHLSWKNHIESLNNNLIKYTTIFYRIRNIVPPKVAEQIYYAFVYSRLIYGIEIYGMAKSSSIKPLQTMQNRVLKILTFKNKRYSTFSLYNDLDLLKINQLHTYSVAVLIYKYSKNMLPTLYENIFKPKNSNCNINRRNMLFNTTHVSRCHGKSLMNNYCCKIWNKLPISIRQSQSVRVFKKQVKLHLRIS